MVFETGGRMRLMAIIAALAASSISFPVQAEELRGVWFAGATLSDSQSGYAGGILALPGSGLGRGLAMRISANAGSYDYEGGAQRIAGSYRGAEVALVYQASGAWGWANFSAGPRLTDTRLRPDDPDNRRKGTRLDAGAQLDGAVDGPDWRLGWLGSAGLVDQNFQTRLQLGRKISEGRYRIGLEAGILGDPIFTKEHAGAFIALPFVGKSEMQLGSGLVFQEEKSAQLYGSVQISSVF
jgi:hypothetical protein